MAPALILTFLLAGSFAPAARIVAEWDPGVSEAELGGQLVVDGYGINGLGAYQVRLDDGTTVLAVCIQADVGHSLAAEYAVDGTVALGAELGYLAWTYLRPGATPTDEEAAAVNALAWRYTGAQRRTGGPVWPRDELEIRVLGVGRLTAIEAAVAALHAEAVARRGPWALTDASITAGTAAVRLGGPGGPIAGIAVRFDGDGGWSASATTDVTGAAAIAVPAGVVTVTASASAPGTAIALVARGSQRLATPGPAVVLATALAVPTTTTTTLPPTTTTLPPTTTTTTTTTTLPPTTTTTLPPTTTTSSTTSTTPDTTTTTTDTTTTTPTTVVPPTSGPPTTVLTVPPPTLPRTGPAGPEISRWAAVLFAGGAGAILVATPRRHPGDRRPVRRSRPDRAGSD